MPTRRLALWSLLAFLVLAALAAVRTADWSYGADTGTFVQLILDTPHGMRDGIEQGTHFLYHWSPALALLWPLLALAGPAAIWVLQAVLAAATAACGPLFAAGSRRWLAPPLAERAGYVALLYPPLVAVGFGEFRDLGLLPALALGWWLALERRAWWWFGAATLLLAGLREDVCIELGIAAVALLVADARACDGARRAALGVSAGAAAISLAVYQAAVLPRLGTWPPSHFYDYPFAHGPAALLAAPFTHPLAFIAAIATFGRLTYLLEAFIPLLLVPLRTRVALFAFPGLAIVLLANSGLVWRMGMHYAALWIPALLLAFAAGLATLRAPVRWATAALIVSAIDLACFSPLHPLHYLRPSYHALGDARAALACVPAGATLATQDEWYTAVSPRFGPRVDVFRPGDPTADYVVFATDYPNQAFAQTVLPRVEALQRRGIYRAVCRDGNVVALRRTSPP